MGIIEMWCQIWFQFLINASNWLKRIYCFFLHLWVQMPVRAAGLEPWTPDFSGHCRTSTASSKPQTPELRMIPVWRTYNGELVLGQHSVKRDDKRRVWLEWLTQHAHIQVKKESQGPGVEKYLSHWLCNLCLTTFLRPLFVCSVGSPQKQRHGNGTFKFPTLTRA